LRALRQGATKALLNKGSFTVDFMPYEGGQLERGDDSKRLLLALSIGAFLLVGAWALAASTPGSHPHSLDEARGNTPSTTLVTK
jgi:hypothetical protein